MASRSTARFPQTAFLRLALVAVFAGGLGVMMPGAGLRAATDNSNREKEKKAETPPTPAPRHDAAPAPAPHRETDSSTRGNRGRPGSHLPPGNFVPNKTPAEVRQLASERFSERMKSGQLDVLIKTPMARQLRLGVQYKMAEEGDITRRLRLERGVPPGIPSAENPHHIAFHHGEQYHGYVTPEYLRDSFEFHYWGPSFFVGMSYYPRWSPWVDWSWHYHCHPIWDPRPLCCRPIYYEPCPAQWVYFEAPAWTPLPEARCGTWVDARPIAVAEGDYNLQLLAVRFVDPGHPEERLGPRYRVWFRNNSPLPITHPFNVVLLASGDGRLAPGLPQAGMRVAAIEAGDTQSVDLRLPDSVYTLSHDAAGRRSPYTTVHALVDAHHEIPESDRANNGATIPVTEVLPVDPAAFEVDPSTLSPDGEVLLAGEGLGPEAGRAFVELDGREYDGEVLGWYDLGAKVKMPNFAIQAVSVANIVLIRGDGAAANPIRITLVP